jgi:hypothetical protein
MIKDNGSRWLRWVLKQEGGIIQACPNHKDKYCALELSFARHDILYPSREPRSLIYQRKKERRIHRLECR